MLLSIVIFKKIVSHTSKNPIVSHDTAGNTDQKKNTKTETYLTIMQNAHLKF